MMVRLVLAAALAGCSAQPANQSGGNAGVQGPAAPDAPAEPMLLSRDGMVQQIVRGQRFGVALSIHPSVGYDWELDGTTGGIRADGVTEPDFSDVPPGGDTGERTYRFIATEPGPATLRFVHMFRGERREEAVFRVVVTG